MAGAESDRVLLAHVLKCIVIGNLQVIAESTQRLSDALKATEPTIGCR